MGLTESFADGSVRFRDDLAENIANGDANYLAMLDAADDYIRRNGLDLPEEPEARRRLPDPECMTHPLRELDLAAAGITSIIWATGYRVDFSWLQVDSFEPGGKPRHHRGVGHEPGIYFLACPGCRAVARPSSGACGMTPSSWPTTSPSSAATATTTPPPAAGSR